MTLAGRLNELLIGQNLSEQGLGSIHADLLLKAPFHALVRQGFTDVIGHLTTGQFGSAQELVKFIEIRLVPSIDQGFGNEDYNEGILLALEELRKV